MVDLSAILAHITGVPHTFDGPYFVCAEPGGEPHLARWDVAKLGTQPTGEQMAVAALIIAKVQAIAASTAACDAVLAPFGSEYGVWETATFDQQYSEALAYTASPTADVPLLAAMCVARGISIAELAGKIIANRAAWVALTGYVIGQRQRIVELVEAATTLEEVAAVDMTISLPG